MSSPRVDTSPSGPLPHNAMAPRKRPWLLWLLLTLFVVLPIGELAVIGAAGTRLGLLPTLLLLLASGALGAWLSKREGARAWQALNGAFRAGRMPSGELADGALVLVGGVLLMLPGFISDVLGLLLLLPFTRPAFRMLLASAIARQTRVRGGLTSRPASPRPTTDDVIRGEAVEVAPTEIERPR